MTQPSPKRQPLSPRAMLLLGASLVLTFYFMITYTGPYQWLAELQLRWHGSYSEKLTFLFVYLPTFAVLALISVPLKYLPPVPGGTIAGHLLTRVASALTTRRAVFALIGLVFAGLGVRDYYRASHAGPLTNLDVAQLEAGRPPQSTWVRAHGYALTDAAIEYGKTTANADRYIPVISRATDPRQTGIHLFLKARPGTAVPSNPDQPGQFEGLLTPADLPGPVRTSLQQQSLLPPGDQYYVLDLNLTPATRMSRAKPMIYIGAGLTLATLLFSLAYSILRRHRG